jgi:hypothetical protein
MQANINMQQIPQPQMIVQNPQMEMGNPQQIPQSQLYQIVQSDSTKNRCEKFSNWLTGSYNIPLVVFLIFMGSSLFFINTLFMGRYIPMYICFSSLANFLFALFVWGPMAIKIEKNTSTVRYGCLYIINNTILSICTLSFPLSIHKIWSFVLFETLLIALSNKDKKMKFFCCKIGGNAVIISSIIYSLLFNMHCFFSLIFTVGYTFAYKKYLINKFGISNEKVERIENGCLINCLKNKLTTFITLKDVLEKEKEKQPLVQNNNIPNINNSSFIPMNMYPNYYSGVAPQQMQPMQQIPHAEGIKTFDSNGNIQ